MSQMASTVTSMRKNRNGTGCVYPRGSVWWFKYHRNGKPYFESSHSKDKKEAEKQLRRRLGEIDAGKFQGLAPTRITIGQLCEMVITHYRSEKKRSLQDVIWRVNKHLNPNLGKIKAAEFGSVQVKRYIELRRDAKAADSTINRELSIIRRGFTLAEKLDPPILARAPHIPKLEETNIREGFLEHDQYLKLRDALPDHLKALFVVSYHVGVRLGELRQITWEQVDFRGGEIRLPGRQTKNKHGRTLPIYGEMLHWLAMQKEKRDQTWPDCPWVFHYHDRKIGYHLKGWKAACREVGLPNSLFHDLRRSAIRNMERAGVSRTVAMKISGHRTEATYRRYDIVSSQDLKTAGAKMKNYHDAQSGLVTVGEKVN